MGGSSLLRLGISLTEVLISMGILTVGLLGVAALFPVGSFYMQKATIADNGSAIAQSVMNDLLARGMLNPGAWYAMTPSGGGNWQFPTVDGKYTPVRPGPTQPPYAPIFSRPLAEALAQGLVRSSDPAVISKQYGSAFVIDPMFVAAVAPTPFPGAPITSPPTTHLNNRVGYAFPAPALFSFVGTGGSYDYYQSDGWNSWRSPSVPGSSPQQLTWPIRRVTFQQSTGWPMDAMTAEDSFRGGDDLTTDFPPRADRPASQNWEVADLPSVGRTPMARVSKGDYSWIVCVVPTTNAARDGMARNPEGYSYDVSVVVFHKRVLPSSPPGANPSALAESMSTERAVGATIISSGLNGGEILLRDINDNQTAGSPFEQLKTGEWIMLCGPHPSSSTSEPRFVLNWYQVLAIDKEGNGINNFNPAMQRIVTVRGPQWPWRPVTGSIWDYSNLSNDLCVGIFRGAVAVHRKTIRLESLRGGSYGSGATVVVPQGVDPPLVTVGGG